MEKTKTTISKKSTAKIETKSGASYSYKYTELADINEYIENIGETYYQYIDRIEGDDYILTVREIDGVEKPPRRGCRVTQAALKENNNPAQEQGSALTYARRYSLLMAYGLATEDDDASSMSVMKAETTEMKTLEQAENYVINFGTKHKGETLKQVVDKDPKYIEWLSKGESTNATVKKAIEIIEKSFAEKSQEEMSPLGTLNNLIIETNVDYEYFCKHYGVSDIEKLTELQLKEATEVLKNKLAKMPKKEVF